MRVNQNAAGPPDAEAIRRQLDRILASPAFLSAKRSQAFLRFVVERSLAGSVPKEYEIAVEVFQRRADYDPAVDATVRVEASRLRSRLREYYATAGLQDPIRIDVPKGGYAAHYERLREGLQAAVVPGGPPRRTARQLRGWGWAGAGIAVLSLAAASLRFLPRRRPARAPAPVENWTQITDFDDSAVSPALSADGRILTFIRGDDTFLGPGQIYAKVMPDGPPVPLTRDAAPKMSPALSPDGSTIAYTDGIWNTWAVPLRGGAPRLMLPNATGLAWIDTTHLLFSTTLTGDHMAVVTATITGGDRRTVYVPPRERGMAHRSALSPDHKWVLVAAMDNGGWLPCRLIPFAGRSAGRIVGPPGAGCTYVAWSPDGKWMYLSSDKGGRFHIWRQRFPDGVPRQVTSGATEEEGIAMEPDGKSLITSVGMRESAIWVHDAHGERQMSSEGFATDPKFSPDGSKVYYLIQPNGVSGKFESGQLWVSDLSSGHSRRLLPHTVVTGYDIARDGSTVAYSVEDGSGRTKLWVASLNFRFAPWQFPSSRNQDQPSWDGAGHIYFREADGKLNFLYRMNADGSDRRKVSPTPILEFFGVSPDARWAAVAAVAAGQPDVSLVPTGGGNPVLVSTDFCIPAWTRDGKALVVISDPMEGALTYVLPVNAKTGLPALPAAGLETADAVRQLKGAMVLDGAVVFGPRPGLSVTERDDIHRNLFRVPLPPSGLRR